MAKSLLVTRENNVLVLTINRPPRNEIDRTLLESIDQALEREVPAAGAVVVRGLPSAFSSGADLNLVDSLARMDEARELSSFGQRVFRRIERASVPFIAAVSGFCLGGGLELALACHIRLAGDRARFGFPEIALGIVPGFGGTARAVEVCGRSRALELMLSARVVGAEEAREMGLVQAVYPRRQLEEKALELARRLAGMSREAVGAVLTLAHPKGAGREEHNGKESEAFSALLFTGEARGKISRFLRERKKPGGGR